MTTLDLQLGLFQDLEHSMNDDPSYNNNLEDQGGWLETTSDLHAFMNALPETEDDETTDVEAVINDMEQFLQSCEKKPDETCRDETDKDMLAAEALLDELIKESPASPQGQENQMIDLTKVNKVITEDGQEVLIVIEQPSLKDHDYSKCCNPKSFKTRSKDSEVETCRDESDSEVVMDHTPITSEDMDAAEDLLDELLKSSDFNWDILDGDQEVETVINEVEQFLQTVEPPAKSVEEQTPSILEEQVELVDHHMDFSNVTKVVTDDGEEIIIMIAPPSPPPPATSTVTTSSSPTSTTSLTSPTENSSNSLNDEDPDWTPSNSSSSIGRPALAKRYAKKNQRKSPYVTNRKERKKQQNVEAARRYRDKKKDEENSKETEVELLSQKNIELKSQVDALEAEVKTMKKIVKELGLF